MKLLVTGASGLVGSEVCSHFALKGWKIHGVDNNQRAVFFGPAGDTRWNQSRLQQQIAGFEHHEIDIRNRDGILELVRTIRPDAIVHTAAQPSHDRAAAIPFDDFDTNAVGTFNLLEAVRQASPESPFVHMSTNKVYGDRPNTIAVKELETRWDYADPAYEHGIAESFSIDQSKHSLFGASKVAADIVVQEYGRYFNMPTCCLRGGCLTGPNHSGVELHGFLSYLVKCNLEGREYRVLGTKANKFATIFTRRTWPSSCRHSLKHLDAPKCTIWGAVKPTVVRYWKRSRSRSPLRARLSSTCTWMKIG